MEAIAKQQGFTVSDEDFRRQIEKVAQEFGMEAEAVAPSLEGSRQRIEYGILLDKAVDYLREHAEVVLVDEQPEVEQPEVNEEESGEGK